MSRRLRPHYRPGLGWILGIAFEDTLTRPVRLAQRFTFVRCCGSPRASSPHGLAAPGPASHDGVSLRAVASGSRLLPTRPAKDFHLQSSAHARHTSHAALGLDKPRAVRWCGEAAARGKEGKGGPPRPLLTTTRCRSTWCLISVHPFNAIPASRQHGPGAALSAPGVRQMSRATRQA
jgi:hypothetical protein